MTNMFTNLNHKKECLSPKSEDLFIGNQLNDELNIHSFVMLLF